MTSLLLHLCDRQNYWHHKVFHWSGYHFRLPDIPLILNLNAFLWTWAAWFLTKRMYLLSSDSTHWNEPCPNRKSWIRYGCIWSVWFCARYKTCNHAGLWPNDLAKRLPPFLCFPKTNVWGDRNNQNLYSSSSGILYIGVLPHSAWYLLLVERWFHSCWQLMVWACKSVLLQQRWCEVFHIPHTICGCVAPVPVPNEILRHR